MKTTIIYHQVKEGVDCPDGSAAAWVAHKACPDACIQGATYQSEDVPQFGSGDRVVIVDFSFPRQTIEQWESDGAEIVLIDHHKTALEHLGDLSGFSDRVTLKFDMGECGATLTWKYFFPDKSMPAFLAYVRDRDLWNWDLLHSEEIHEAVSSLKYNYKKHFSESGAHVFDLFDALAKLDSVDLISLIAPLGASLLAPKREKIRQAFNRCEWGEVAGYGNIPFVRLAEDGSEDRLVSDICMKLYREFPHAYFVACLTSDGSWSLRSDKRGNNTDVGAIAKAQGGGGHVNASGFKPQHEGDQL